MGIVVLAGALLIASSERWSWCDSEFDYFDVSIPSVTLAPGESIYGIDIKTESAVIVRTKIPLVWDLSVDNSEGERTEIKAEAIVGAAALNETGSRYFQNLFEVARYKHPSLTRFEINVTLEIRNNKTEAERTIRLPLKQIILKPSVPP